MRKALVFVTALALGFGAALFYMFPSPAGTRTAVVDPMTTGQQKYVADRLQQHVEYLAGTLGARNLHAFPKQLHAAEKYIEDALTGFGYKVEKQEFEVDGKKTSNLVAEIKGTKHPEEIIIFGAHYDTCYHSTGANDNGSGIAAVLEMAHTMRDMKPERTVRFVAFTNEEPPYFRSEDMGSCHYANLCKSRNENIVGMFAVETIGYYRDEKGSQKYPVPGMGWFFGNRANYLAFVGNFNSRGLINDSLRYFKANCGLPTKGVSAPSFISGIDWSDQLYFWKNGFKGVMVTDTALYRDPNYHTEHDLPGNLNYYLMADIVSGLTNVAMSL